MGCNNSQNIQSTINQKQLLKQISSKLKNYKQEFKSYSQYHRMDQKTKSVLLTKCSTFSQTKNMIKYRARQKSEKYIKETEREQNQEIFLVAKFPSKKVEKENDVLFVDGKLIFLTDSPKIELEQDVDSLLRTLKENGISVAEYLSGNREQILEEIRDKEEKMKNMRKNKIVGEYFNEEVIDQSFYKH